MSKKRNLYIDTFDPTNLNFYYGIPNFYSGFSIGKGTPYESLEYGKRAGFDFLAVTDLNIYLNSNIKTSDGIVSKWQGIKQSTTKFSKRNDNFISLSGFQCKTNSLGDLNIINPDLYFNGYVKDLKLLALWMINNPNSFITIHTPPLNFKPIEYNLILNKLITSMDVGASHQCDKSTLYEKFYYYMLDLGWRLGAINGQNTQKLHLGDTENITVFISNKLSKSELIASFRNRRTYSAQSRFLKLYFTINDAFMGDNIIITPEESLTFNINVEDSKFKIHEIHIITNKFHTIQKLDNINLNAIKYMYTHKNAPSESWYLIKIIQDDCRIALSSPIFVSYK